MNKNKTNIEAKKQLVPELRFNEFDEVWGNSKFGDVNEVLDSLHQTPKEYIDEGYAMIRVTDVNNGRLDIDKCLKVSEEVFNEFTKRHIPRKGDIIMSRVGTCGAAIKLNSDEPVCLGQNTVLLIPKIEKSFAFTFMTSRFFQNQVDRMVVGSTQKTLSLRDLKKFNINIPSLPEQQKIATFLSAVDKKIAQLTRKKALLEQYKKGVMQQLFSRQIRFKDEQGRAFPEWEEKLYGEVYSFYSTNSLSRDKLNYENGVVKNIHYGDIHTKFKTLFDIKKEYVPFINIDVNLSKIKPESYCQEGDMIIADASEDYADIGKAIELVNLNGEKLISGLHTFLIRPDKSKIHTGFSGYLVQAWYIRKQIMTIAQGTKVLGLSTKRMAKLKLQIPSKKEQQKIANYLSAIDKKIDNVTNQITKSQAFKKGLLQQLFV